MSDKRKSRPEPQRPGYERGYSTSFRDSDSWDWTAEPGDENPSNGSSGPSGWTDAIGDGVRMGYRVIEEQIRQGQRVAEQINERFYQGGPARFAGQDVTQKMWRSYWDLAAMWWDYMGSLTGGPGFPPRAPGWGNGDHSQERVDPELAIEVHSERATRVGLVLTGLRRSCCSLVALVLHGAGGERLAGEIEFAPVAEGQPLRVDVRVAADQAPGTYSGKVVDGSSGEPCGTLTVVVGD